MVNLIIVVDFLFFFVKLHFSSLSFLIRTQTDIYTTKSVRSFCFAKGTVVIGCENSKNSYCKGKAKLSEY